MVMTETGVLPGRAVKKEESMCESRQSENDMIGWWSDTALLSIR